MENMPLIKWHAQELHKLLLKSPNDSTSAEVAIKLETIFLNSRPYKNIKAQPPESHK